MYVFINTNFICIHMHMMLHIILCKHKLLVNRDESFDSPILNMKSSKGSLGCLLKPPSGPRCLGNQCIRR